MDENGFAGAQLRYAHNLHITTVCAAISSEPLTPSLGPQNPSISRPPGRGGGVPSPAQHLAPNPSISRGDPPSPAGQQPSISAPPAGCSRCPPRNIFFLPQTLIARNAEVLLWKIASGSHLGLWRERPPPPAGPVPPLDPSGRPRLEGSSDSCCLNLGRCDAHRSLMLLGDVAQCAYFLCRAPCLTAFFLLESNIEGAMASDFSTSSVLACGGTRIASGSRLLRPSSPLLRDRAISRVPHAGTVVAALVVVAPTLLPAAMLLGVH